MSTLDPRTRLLLEGPIAPTLLRLALPTTLVMAAQAGAGLVETWFVGRLGTDALAGMGLVFPLVMLMQMMSAGAMGGGIASAIARALGARRSDDANALVLHAMVVALLLSALFSGALLWCGPWLYARMGGQGASLAAALTYSNWVFAGAALVWLSNSLAAVVRGAGNMLVPAVVNIAGLALLVPLSPLLIFGIGPVPAFGIAGGAMALLLYYALSAAAMALYLWSPRSLLRPRLWPVRLRRALFTDILKVGLVASVTSAATNLTIGVTTGLVGAFGSQAIAGYGTGVRLEYLLVPLVFGLGGPMVAMVGTCIGAGQRQRALQVTWTGACMAAAVTECIGLVAALFPNAWLRLFDSDPAMLDAGARYLRLVGPVYGFFGLGLALYFASQGAGRMLWPLAGNLLRLAFAVVLGVAVVQAGLGLDALFAVQAGALLIYGAVNAMAVAGGTWFGPLGWPQTPARLVQRLAPTPPPCS